MSNTQEDNDLSDLSVHDQTHFNMFILSSSQNQFCGRVETCYLLFSDKK